MPVSTYTDYELLEAIQLNDQRAFEELFKRHWKKVHAMAYARVRSVEVTEEIVQDLFVSIWQKRASLSIKHLPSYLYSAVKNKVLNYIESEEVRQRHWNYYSRFIPHNDLATGVNVEMNELMESIEKEINRLPEKSKKIVKLNSFEGRSITEIASLLHLSEKAIQYHLTQSIKRLRLHLKNLTIIISFSLLF